MIKRHFTGHPATVGESYGQHLWHSMSFAAAMLAGAIVCFVHALIPSMFERTGSGIIQRLHERMVSNRNRQHEV
ncbi:DUF6356 family protein [Sphingobium amiense]|uniref:DUF6356 family protein n=1 Tax=Sphingobium amiense TaxID=135719 RepID=UPI000832F77A|nr:DUF6356 family protein [Sphingobium amiense]